MLSIGMEATAFTADDDAAIVLLREDCQDPAQQPGNDLHNCFELMDDLANPTSGWIWTTRRLHATKPLSETHPLLVDMGPGEFGLFRCPNLSPPTGYVQLRGSGREQTVIRREFDSAVEIDNCTQMGFSNLTVEGEAVAVEWKLGGDSVWDDVDIIVQPGIHNIGWLSTTCGPDPSRHLLTGTRIRAAGIALFFNIAIWNACADMKFYGGEILLDFSDPASSIGATLVAQAIRVEGTGGIEVFGTAVRSRSIDGPAYPHALALIKNELIGVQVTGSASFRMHAGIINTSVINTTTTQSNVGATALHAQNSSSVNTINTAFIVRSEAAHTRIRDDGSGTVEAPFLWEYGDKPPRATDETNVLTSTTGADLYVETDCVSGGSCSSGTEPHLMVYNDAECPTEKWFDLVTGCCRNDTTCAGP